jgi:hypothetical protein
MSSKPDPLDLSHATPCDLDETKASDSIHPSRDDFAAVCNTSKAVCQWWSTIGGLHNQPCQDEFVSDQEATNKKFAICQKGVQTGVQDSSNGSGVCTVNHYDAMRQSNPVFPGGLDGYTYYFRK